MKTISHLRAKVRREGRRLAETFAPDAPSKHLPLDVTDAEARIVRHVQPHTMTSPERIVSLLRAVAHVVAADVPGDLVECGVAAGGSAMAMALQLLKLKQDDRTLWLYDTFAGMPAPGPEDRGREGRSAMPRYRRRLKDGVSTWIYHPLEEVQTALATTGYPPDRLRFVRGKVEETLPQTKPAQIALLRLDTDWYASTRAEMHHLWPRLAPGGVIIADDYYRWQGARKAIDEHLEQEFRAGSGRRVFWARIDEHSALAVKPY